MSWTSKNAAKKLREGDRVRFRTPASHVLGNEELDISGMTGTVTELIPGQSMLIELDSDEYADDLEEWGNALQFELNEDHWPEIESVREELEARKLPFKPCGLNADWNVEAWMLSEGEPNRVDGAYYLLDTENDVSGVPHYIVVQRFDEELEENGKYRDNPRYDASTNGIEEIIDDGPLNEVLDAYASWRQRSKRYE